MSNKRKPGTRAGAELKVPALETAPVAGGGGGSSLDVSALREIVELLEASEVTRLVWKRGDEKLYITRGSAHAAPQIVHHAPAAVSPMMAAPMQAMPMQQMAAVQAPASPAASAPPAAAPAPAAEKPGHVITSPFVGTFYRASSPEQPPFVEVGASVRKGQTLCIIEAMKLMNEIESEVEGKVAEVLVENGQPVEFGQPLFRIEKP